MAKKKDDNKEAGLTIFGMGNVQFKKYESLMPKNDYDREKAETLAEAMTELIAIKKRKKYLETLLEENKTLKPFLWESLDGRVQALHAIDDSHFGRIISYLAVRGRAITKEIRAEAAIRGVEIPEDYTADGEGFDDEGETITDYAMRKFASHYRQDWGK